MADTIQQHIEIVQGAGGPKARVAGHRVRVQDVVIWAEKLGMSPDEILLQYPTLTLADVHAALTYYWDHRGEIEQAIAEERALSEALGRVEGNPLHEKLLRRRNGDEMAGRVEFL